MESKYVISLKPYFFFRIILIQLQISGRNFVSKIDFQHLMQYQRQVEEGEVIYQPDPNDDNGYFLRAWHCVFS